MPPIKLFNLPASAAAESHSKRRVSAGSNGALAVILARSKNLAGIWNPRNRLWHYARVFAARKIIIIGHLPLVSFRTDVNVSRYAFTTWRGNEFLELVQ